MIVHAVECRSDCGNFYFCQGNYSKQGKDLVRQVEKIKTWLCANYFVGSRGMYGRRRRKKDDCQM